jgi:hypothetical protein
MESFSSFGGVCLKNSSVGSKKSETPFSKSESHDFLNFSSDKEMKPCPGSAIFITSFR